MTTVKDKRNGSACLLLPAVTSQEPKGVGDAVRAWPLTKQTGQAAAKGEIKQRLDGQINR